MEIEDSPTRFVFAALARVIAALTALSLLFNPEVDTFP